VGTWAEDPELLSTFRAEVEERLASLSAGLLQLESNGSPRQLIAGLFRDAHTVKGSARMMGLTAVLHTAHAAEDLLGALRDGRFQVRRDYVDLLLATVDGIGRSIAPNPTPAVEEYLTELVNALRGALEGDDRAVDRTRRRPCGSCSHPHRAGAADSPFAFDARFTTVVDRAAARAVGCGERACCLGGRRR
jgi:chemotaxis protein histidine kinase CheA